MENAPVCKIAYRRARFSTRLPDDRRYTPSHYWLLEIEPGRFRVGLTQFAIRMLGDLVEYGFEVKPSTPVQLGHTIGWIEAFKAMTDIYCSVTGTFLESNPALEKNPALFDKDPYGEGWLYTVAGEVDPSAMDVHGYTTILDLAIDKILGKTK
jgi:glycine cleavage system H protein